MSEIPSEDRERALTLILDACMASLCGDREGADGAITTARALLRLPEKPPQPQSSRDALLFGSHGNPPLSEASGSAQSEALKTTPSSNSGVSSTAQHVEQATSCGSPLWRAIIKWGDAGVLEGYDCAVAVDREIRALISAVQAQAREAPCVCDIDDGLVQEWVSKARAVAIGKGFKVLPKQHARPCPDCGFVLEHPGRCRECKHTSPDMEHALKRAEVAEARLALMETPQE